MRLPFLNNKNVKYSILVLAVIIFCMAELSEWQTDSKLSERTRRGKAMNNSSRLSVKKEIYIHWDSERGTPVMGCRYVGQGLRRCEIVSYQNSSDWSRKHKIRYSDDNARTWSDWEVLRDEWPRQGDYQMETIEFARTYDPVSNLFLRINFQRICHGDGADVMQNQRFKTDVKWDHNLWLTSDNDGESWSKPRLLKYESGAEFNYEKWNNEKFLKNNQLYGSYTLIPLSNGTVIYPANMPCEIEDDQGDCFVSGIRCFIFKWNKEKKDYEIELSKPVGVPHRVSGRGLTEPSIAQLKDGRLVMTMRGSTSTSPQHPQIKVESPGRCWRAISEDYGKTWSQVSDWRFDNGGQFYSPGAFAKLLRHSSGKLFWVGNITPEPPEGELPRYPLYIAEVNEDKVALIRSTLTMIDTRKPEEPEEVQLSNFKIFENRESGVIELYLSRYGELAPGNYRLAGNLWRYLITLDNEKVNQ
jgi:hypothetical protein